MLIRHACFLCFQEGLIFKFDKWGKPYSTCMLCGSRTFFQSRESLFGPAAFSALVGQVGIVKTRELAQGLAGDPASLIATAAKHEPRPAPAPKVAVS